MKPRFALVLSLEQVSLLHRQKRGWEELGAVPLDDPDFGGRLAELRAAALALSPEGIETKLVLPESQVLYTVIASPGREDRARREAIRRALEGMTPYAVEELAFDYEAEGEVLHVAVVARETLDEAEDFAVGHGLNPVSIVARPRGGSFTGEPFFGETAAAAAILPPGERVERDVLPTLATLKLARPVVAPPAPAGAQGAAAAPPEAAETLPEAPSVPEAATAGFAGPSDPAEAAGQALPPDAPAPIEAGAFLSAEPDAERAPPEPVAAGAPADAPAPAAGAAPPPADEAPFIEVPEATGEAEAEALPEEATAGEPPAGAMPPAPEAAAVAAVAGGAPPAEPAPAEPAHPEPAAAADEAPFIEVEDAAGEAADTPVGRDAGPAARPGGAAAPTRFPWQAAGRDRRPDAAPPPPVPPARRPVPLPGALKLGVTSGELPPGMPLNRPVVPPVPVPGPRTARARAAALAQAPAGLRKVLARPRPGAARGAVPGAPVPGAVPRRRASAARGSPLMAFVLTTGLVAVIAAVGLWSALFNPADPVSDPAGPEDVAAAFPADPAPPAGTAAAPAPEAAAPEAADRVAVLEPPEEAETAPVVAGPADPGSARAPAAAPDAPAGSQHAPDAAGALALAGSAARPGTGAATAGAGAAEAAASDRAASDPAASDPAVPDPAVPEPASPAVAYAATGIWVEAPDAPEPLAEGAAAAPVRGAADPRLPEESPDGLPPAGLAADAAPPPAVPAPPPGAVIAFGPDGLVIPTPEGTPTPEGILVTLGRPPLVPPGRPVPAPAPEPGAGAAATAGQPAATPEPGAGALAATEPAAAPMLDLGGADAPPGAAPSAARAPAAAPAPADAAAAAAADPGPFALPGTPATP
ncbi:MAG: hypothetical protein N2Z62_06170, partial [Rhodobacteraceae bacterium]|nr:hypothetical protein [Paracoccaceae bacterium]